MFVHCMECISDTHMHESVWIRKAVYVCVLVCICMYMCVSMCVHVCMYMLTGQVEDATCTGEHTEMYQTVKVLYKCELDENGKKYCTRIHTF